jgi:nicotinamide-nucleotide amidase
LQVKTSETTDALLDQLAQRITSHRPSLATAESCTGGLLAAAIVSHPGVSSAFERGLVTYSVDAKCELLGLERAHVEACEGVSAHIACAMARAALAESRADLAAAITGFAGPRQGDEEVGLIHVAVAWQGGTIHRELHLGDIGREAACEGAVVAALEMLIERAESGESLAAEDSQSAQ